jgi:type 1 glutamine amidotransferase
MHAKDELYSKLRGPARNLTVLATAYAAPAKKGTGEHEPALMTIRFGQGRVFHTVLGHAPEQMRCVGFIVTYQRGTEWAATGRVTQVDVPDDFPTADEVSLR